MRSLFFKIFVCFWLSHLIVVSILVAILTRVQTQMEEERRPFTTSLTTLSAKQVQAYALRAAELSSQQAAAPTASRGELQAYLQQVQQETGARPVLLKAGRGVVAGEESPVGQALLQRALASGQTEYTLGQRSFGLALPATLPDGQKYVLGLLRTPGSRRGGGAPEAAGGGQDMQRRPRYTGPAVSVLGVRLDRRQVEGVARMIAVFLAAGIVAFGLARYLTAPTVQLRRATLQLAEGDLTARVGDKMGRRRDELADLGKDFDKMAERIQGLMVAERRLLGDISHELGSPLARLKLALELAQQDSAPETQQYLTRIDREANRLDTLIGQLLTLTRLENAQQGSASDASGDFGSVSLDELVAEICSDADFEAQSQGRMVQLVAGEPCVIHGNIELLRSAIENVVRNALLHTPESRPIEVELVRLVPSASEASEGAVAMAVVSVRDYGPGVPPEALTELFRPFYRVAEARDRRSGGVGLGLSITERAVRFHGGTVSASNADGGGLRVELRLPLAR